MKNKVKEILNNKKARFNYSILETLGAGLILEGSEVKSVRNHQVNFADAYIIIKNSEVFVVGLRIEPYKFATYNKPDPTRTRKLLLTKKEIKNLKKQLQTKRLYLIPFSLYFKNGWAKITIGVGESKKKVDKRNAIKKRESNREAERILKNSKRK